MTAMAGSGDEARADTQQGALASIVVATPVYERNPELAFVPVVPLVPVAAVQSAAARVAATQGVGAVSRRKEKRSVRLQHSWSCMYCSKE